ncbi:hypothetical protein [Mitsuokella jalaludinii]|uniref:hypothetical protein n=1 Tax=Mitsuokella jalaludinii TaxID=187979 RepID=UPI00307FBF4C
MKDWKKVQGSQVERPAEFDAASSPTTVYQRRNITQVEIEGTDGTTTAVWNYEERTMSHTEYAALVSETTRSKLEYIAAMTDVDLEGSF